MRFTHRFVTLNLDLVAARLERTGYIDLERRLPQDAEVLAVHGYLGEIPHVAQIEPLMRSGRNALAGISIVFE